MMADRDTGALYPRALRARMLALKQQCGGRVKVFSIGRSVLGQEILTAGIGEIRGAALFVGGVSGQDRQASGMLMRFLEELTLCMKEGRQLAGIDVRRAMADRSLMVIPCLNPDGAALAQNGTEGLGTIAPAIERLAKGGFGGWQANARGVDLRLAYDAGWSRIGEPGPEGYSGARPMSEPECRASANFCRAFSIKRLFVFSSGPREISHRFADESPRARLIAKMLSGACGGKVSERPGAGSLKDWYIHAFDRPAFEVGIGQGSDDAVYDAMLEMMVLAQLL